MSDTSLEKVLDLKAGDLLVKYWPILAFLTPCSGFITLAIYLNLNNLPLVIDLYLIVAFGVFNILVSIYVFMVYRYFFNLFHSNVQWLSNRQIISSYLKTTLFSFIAICIAVSLLFTLSNTEGLMSLAVLIQSILVFLMASSYKQNNFLKKGWGLIVILVIIFIALPFITISNFIYSFFLLFPLYSFSTIESFLGFFKSEEDIKSKVAEINIALFFLLLFYISISTAFLFDREYVDILNFGKQNIEIVNKNNNIKGILIYQSYDGLFVKTTKEGKTKYFKKADIDEIVYLNFLKKENDNIYTKMIKSV